MKTTEKEKAPKTKIMGTTKKVSTEDLQKKVKAKADTKAAEEPTKKEKKKLAEGSKAEAPARSSNYKFPKDADNKERKKFRMKCRKAMESFQDRYAAAKSGASKEKASVVRKEWDEFKAAHYLNPEEISKDAE